MSRAMRKFFPGLLPVSTNSGTLIVLSGTGAKLLFDCRSFRLVSPIAADINSGRA